MDHLDVLRLYVRTVELGGFSQVGKTVGVPASTVSRAIDRLESRLGVPLLHRSTRSTRPTEAGAIYFERARELVRALDELDERVRSMAERPSGRLRLSFPSMHGTAPLLERLIGEFAEAHPDVRVESVATNRHVELVAEGFDVALRGGPILDEGLVAKRLFAIGRRIVATPAYVEEHPPIRARGDLATHTCFAFGEGDAPLRWPLVGGGSVEIDARLRSNDIEVLRRALLASRGIAFVPVGLVHRELSDGRLRIVAPELVADDDHFYVVHPPLRPLPTKVRAFVDHAVAFFRRFPVERARAG